MKKLEKQAVQTIFPPLLKQTATKREGILHPPC
jgi:hypothetical protein